jgi:ribosomal protein uS17
MADDEKNPTEETAETTAEPEAVQEPAADEVVAEPTAEEAAEAAPATGADTAEAATQNPPRERKPKSRRHVPRSDRRQRSKPTREKPAERKPIVRGEKSEIERGRRQERRGVVVSDKGDKTIVVKVDVIKSHPKYKKVIRRTAKFHAHDEANTAGVGDTFRIVETRPLSKTKRWRLAEIVEKAR